MVSAIRKIKSYMVNTAAFFFPKMGENLKVDGTIDVLKKRGLKLSARYSVLRPNDDANGHLVPGIEEFEVNERQVFDEFEKLLRANHNIHIFNESLSIDYAVDGPNPNIAVRWSRKWFYFLRSEVRETYLSLLLEFADISNSTFVIFIEDLFDMYDDRFEDRFVSYDALGLLDDSPKRKSKWDFMIDQIWIKGQANFVVKSKRKLSTTGVLGKGFTAYELVKANPDGPEYFLQLL